MTVPDTLFTVGETHGRALRPENHPFIIYHITHPCEVTRKLEGARREKGLLGTRNICVTLPETITEWEHHGWDASAAEIVPRFGIVDPLLEQLTIALADALM